MSTVTRSVKHFGNQLFGSQGASITLSENDLPEGVKTYPLEVRLAYLNLVAEVYIIRTSVQDGLALTPEMQQNLLLPFQQELAAQYQKHNIKV